MRPLVLVLIAVSFLATGCASVTPDKDHWFGKDKAYHFVVSSLIAGVSTAVADDQGLDKDESLPIAIGVTLSIGVGKEARDQWSGKSGWSWKDLFWDLLGAVAGSFIVQEID